MPVNKPRVKTPLVKNL